MENAVIRINRVTLTNIKNVKYGSIDLNKVNSSGFGSSIVGVYGQNGSGKTTLIWAMEIVKDALSGVSLPEDSAYYIRQSATSASICVEFLVKLNERDYSALYSIEFSKTENNRIAIIREGLEYSAKSYNNLPQIKRRKILEINYPLSLAENINTCFYKPDNRISEWGAVDKQVRQKLLVIQALAREKKQSFIFNKQVVDIYNDTNVNKLHLDIINALMFYGRMNLFVLNRNSESSYNMYLLPLSMRIESNNTITKSDSMPIGLGRNIIDKNVFNRIQRVIEQIDILIGKIIPGLHVEITNKENQLNQKGEEMVAFDLVSNREGVITPLRYESEGIKKILCILSSLIAMYNNESVFVAIDEMDAGIFEYLLGEILDVINKTGKGQLLFTSHNMRPLEVLDNINIYFTTTNPENKYIQFTGIKENNNLRNTLLRTIDLGGQKESIYESTSSYEIGKAFRKAGESTNV